MHDLNWLGLLPEGCVNVARCTTFNAAGLPFFTCNRESGSFVLSAVGQQSVIAARSDARDDPPYLVSMSHEKDLIVLKKSV